MGRVVRGMAGETWVVSSAMAVGSPSTRWSRECGVDAVDGAMAARMVVSCEFERTRTWRRIADDRDPHSLAQLFSECEGAAPSHASHGRLAVPRQQRSSTGAT
jgi:hypothetical protein